jgi:hypothetical protein
MKKKTPLKKLKLKKPAKAVSQPTLSKEFEERVLRFVDNVNIRRLNRNLRFMLIAYLLENEAGLPLYHEDLLIDLESLFHFLDDAETEKLITD